MNPTIENNENTYPIMLTIRARYIINVEQEYSILDIFSLSQPPLDFSSLISFVTAYGKSALHIIKQQKLKINFQFLKGDRQLTGIVSEVDNLCCYGYKQIKQYIAIL